MSRIILKIREPRSTQVILAGGRYEPLWEHIRGGLTNAGISPSRVQDRSTPKRVNITVIVKDDDPSLFLFVNFPWKRKEKPMNNETAKIDAEISRIKSDPSISGWLKSTLSSAVSRDCLDAEADAKLLADLLERRSSAILQDALSAKDGDPG